MDSSNIKYLLAFCMFVEHGGIVAAAKELGVSQSTLSMHLSALEQNIGITLFRMVGTRKELSTYGQRLYDKTSGDLRSLVTHLKRLKHDSETSTYYFVTQKDAKSLMKYIK